MYSYVHTTNNKVPEKFKISKMKKISILLKSNEDHNHKLCSYIEKLSISICNFFKANITFTFLLHSLPL